MAENQNFSTKFGGSTQSDIGLICLQVWFLMPQITTFIPLAIYSKTCLKRNLKGPEYFSAEATFPFNQGIL
jgi:hypothetical protein